MSSSTETYPSGYMEVNHGGRVTGAVTFILIFTSALLILRLYARSLTKATRGWDEFLLVPSYLLMLGLFICLYVDVVQGGLGQHVAKVKMENPQKVVTFLELLYILDWFYVPSNAMSRISVVALYLRIFTNRTHRAFCWFVVAFLLGIMAATIIAAQVECFPLQYTWDRTIEGGHCFNQVFWYQITNVPNVVADVMILALPIPTVWKLHASTTRKVGIATVFLTGSIGLIASCMRTAVFYSQGHVIATDPTYSDEAFSWTAVECGMYFSAACLVGLRPVLSKITPWIDSCLSHIPGLPKRRISGSQHTILPKYRDYRRSQSPVLMSQRGIAREGVAQSDEFGETNGLTVIKMDSNPSRVESKGSDDDGDIRVQTKVEILREDAPSQRP